MEKYASIVHGVASNPYANWFQIVKQQLLPLAYDSIISKYPSNREQNAPHYPAQEDFDDWDAVFEANSGPQIEKIDTLIGHSLGGTFLLRKLEQDLKKKFKIVCTVSSTIGAKPIKGYDGDVSSFIQQGEFDWGKIRSSADHFIHFHGTNDPYIEPREAEILAEHTGGKLVMIPNGGHLNAEAGYIRFDRLFQEVEPILRSA